MTTTRIIIEPESRSSMFRFLFKSPEQREMERRMTLRRSARSIEKSMRKLAQQRERYYVMGRAAAKNGSGEKVRLIARAMQRCNQMARRMDAARTAIDLLETQQDIAKAQSSFAQSMQDTQGLLRDADLAKAFAGFDLSISAAAVAQEEIEALTEMMMDTTRDFSEIEDNEEDVVAALEAELRGAHEEKMPIAPETEAAEEPAPARTEKRDEIEEDLKELQRELNLEV